MHIRYSTGIWRASRRCGRVPDKDDLRFGDVKDGGSGTEGLPDQIIEYFVSIFLILVFGYVIWEVLQILIF